MVTHYCWLSSGTFTFLCCREFGHFSSLRLVTVELIVAEKFHDFTIIAKDVVKVVALRMQ